jgi:hypothetical protein|tara:strand:+ start:430 stop:825 length:396 start_codon:yes stop_codon:yes gene_type:complete
MKNALINTSTKRIIRVQDGDFLDYPDHAEVISISDAKASAFESSTDTMFYIDNQLKTLDQKIWTESPEIVKNNIRYNRNKLLSDSDWTQLADSPLSSSKKTEWVTYRQSLRDLTDNVDSSGQVTYPALPSS